MSSEALAKVRAILVQAYGGNLDGSDRGPLVSTTYLAQIRDIVRDLAAAPADTATDLAADATHAKLVEIADKLRAERKAHVETRAELDHWKGPGEPRASCTRGERKVLEAMAAFPTFVLEQMLATVEGPTQWVSWERELLQAELAGRGGNPFAGVRASDWLKELDDERGEKPCVTPPDGPPEACSCDEALTLRARVQALKAERSNQDALHRAALRNWNRTTDDLRERLVNIYHLTLTGGEDAAAVRAIRAASSPGAPAPARGFSGTETQHGRCGVDCLACAVGAPPERGSNA